MCTSLRVLQWQTRLNECRIKSDGRNKKKKYDFVRNEFHFESSNGIQCADKKKIMIEDSRNREAVYFVSLFFFLFSLSCIRNNKKDHDQIGRISMPGHRIGDE